MVWIVREFLTERIDGPCEIVRLHCGGAQSLYRISALGDCIRSLLHRGIQFFLHLDEAVRDQLRDNFEPQH